jgi:transposase-like protein
MRHKTERHQGAAERTVKDIRRKTRKHYSSEEKIRIVLAGLRGEDSIARDDDHSHGGCGAGGEGQSEDA